MWSLFGQPIFRTASFVPDQPQRELRELTRYRTSLVQERSRKISRLQKTLEGANIKLAAVATDILGKPGRAVLRHLVGGSTDAPALADLAKGRLRAKMPALKRELVGRFGAHSILVIVYHLLKHGTTFTDLGGDYFDQRDKDATERRLIRRLEDLGNKVSIERVA